MQAKTQRNRTVDPILAEMDQEAKNTRRLLEIVPEDKLSWRPHPKSMSLGQLALHIATMQAGVAELARNDSAEVPNFRREEATNRAQILQAFEESLAKAKDIVAATDDAGAVSEWKLMNEGKVLMALPRINFWRSILLNHLYHHRGQLTVYLRELDVPVPPIYGPSADTDPFAGR